MSVLLRPTPEGVLVFLDAQFIHRDVMTLLLLDILLDCRLIQPDRTHVVSLRPEMPVAELVLKICVLVEYHERALPLQIPHYLGHAVLRRYAHQHVDVVRHQVPLDYLHTLVAAQLPEYVPYALLVLIVNYFSPILRSEYYVVFAQPLGMC